MYLADVAISVLDKGAIWHVVETCSGAESIGEAGMGSFTLLSVPGVACASYFCAERVARRRTAMRTSWRTLCIVVFPR